MRLVWWLLSLGFLLVGALGYLEEIIPVQIDKRGASALLVAFLALSLGQIILSRRREARQVEDLYSKEIVEVFPPNAPEDSLKFSADRAGNKCVVVTLKREPIPKSVRLFEGGYEAPPITLGFSGRRVIFRHSGYSSRADYQERKGPMYQVRYFPR